MPRYKIIVEYDGGGFVGWQRQDNGVTVQQALEEAIAGFSGERAVVFGAGRTDSGVHAMGQVAHFDLERTFPPYTVQAAINQLVKPHGVAVLNAQEVDGEFHAQFSAKERRYLYRILNRRPPAVLDKGRVWWAPRPLDADAMHAAAQGLLGHHDFTTFRASMCQAKSPMRTLDQLDVVREGDEIRVHARAPSFLHHQVRNLVGTLVLVGDGRWTAERVREALDARDRSAGGPTAPPTGLYLVEVVY